MYNVLVYTTAPSQYYAKHECADYTACVKAARERSELDGVAGVEIIDAITDDVLFTVVDGQPVALTEAR